MKEYIENNEREREGEILVFMVLSTVFCRQCSVVNKMLQKEETQTHVPFLVY